MVSIRRFPPICPPRRPISAMTIEMSDLDGFVFGVATIRTLSTSSSASCSEVGAPDHCKGSFVHIAWSAIALWHGNSMPRRRSISK